MRSQRLRVHLCPALDQSAGAQRTSTKPRNVQWFDSRTLYDSGARPRRDIMLRVAFSRRFAHELSLMATETISRIVKSGGNQHCRRRMRRSGCVFPISSLLSLRRTRVVRCDSDSDVQPSSASAGRVHCAVDLIWAPGDPLGIDSRSNLTYESFFTREIKTLCSPSCLEA